jgi:hypothetical protein
MIGFSLHLSFAQAGESQATSVKMGSEALNAPVILQVPFKDHRGEYVFVTCTRRGADDPALPCRK